MIGIMATYRVRKDCVEEVGRAVREFIAAVRENEPFTTYHAYGVEDGVTFVHVMTFPDRESEEAHRTAPYTVEFTEVVYPCCVVEPEFTPLEPIEPERGE
jgi:quinol monooxygenase YgiN